MSQKEEDEDSSKRNSVLIAAQLLGQELRNVNNLKRLSIGSMDLMIDPELEYRVTANDTENTENTNKFDFSDSTITSNESFDGSRSSSNSPNKSRLSRLGIEQDDDLKSIISNNSKRSSLNEDIILNFKNGLEDEQDENIDVVRNRLSSHYKSRRRSGIVRRPTKLRYSYTEFDDLKTTNYEDYDQNDEISNDYSLNTTNSFDSSRKSVTLKDITNELNRISSNAGLTSSDAATLAITLGLRGSFTTSSDSDDDYILNSTTQPTQKIDQLSTKDDSSSNALIKNGLVIPARSSLRRSKFNTYTKNNSGDVSSKAQKKRTDLENDTTSPKPTISNDKSNGSSPAMSNFLDIYDHYRQPSSDLDIELPINNDDIESPIISQGEANSTEPTGTPFINVTDTENLTPQPEFIAALPSTTTSQGQYSESSIQHTPKEALQVDVQPTQNTKDNGQYSNLQLSEIDVNNNTEYSHHNLQIDNKDNLDEEGFIDNIDDTSNLSLHQDKTFINHHPKRNGWSWFGSKSRRSSTTTNDSKHTEESVENNDSASSTSTEKFVREKKSVNKSLHFQFFKSSEELSKHSNSSHTDETAFDVGTSSSQIIHKFEKTFGGFFKKKGSKKSSDSKHSKNESKHLQESHKHLKDHSKSSRHHSKFAKEKLGQKHITTQQSQEVNEQTQNSLSEVVPEIPLNKSTDSVHVSTNINLQSQQAFEESNISNESIVKSETVATEANISAESLARTDITDRHNTIVSQETDLGDDHFSESTYDVDAEPVASLQPALNVVSKKAEYSKIEQQDVAFEDNNDFEIEDGDNGIDQLNEFNKEIQGITGNYTDLTASQKNQHYDDSAKRGGLTLESFNENSAESTDFSGSNRQTQPIVPVISGPPLRKLQFSDVKKNDRPNGPVAFADSAFGFPLPMLTVSTIIMFDHRLSVNEERAIYRLSHLKLSEPKRELRQQVILSNFMYAYLHLVNHTLYLEQNSSRVGNTKNLVKA